MIHMKLVSVPVCTKPDAVDVTDQDCLTTLHDTSLVENLACYPSPRLTITCCFPTCLIPTEINSGMLCDKLDVLNKAYLYVINVLVWIVTVLSFLCCYVFVTECFDYF